MATVDLFLSHSSGDAEIARELRVELEAAGYSCWMAPDDVTGTDPWAEQILAAIENSKAMLVLLSANANRSPHVSREVNLAVGRKRAVLPVRIENVTPEASLEYLLSLMQRIDAFPPPIANHRDRILRRLAAIVPLPVAPVIAEPPTETTSFTGDDAIDAPVDVPTEVMPAAVVPARPARATPTSEALGDGSRVLATPQSTAPPPTPMGLLAPGVTVGAFTIESLVGEGGMASVYRATQAEPNRRVALKVIRADHAADPSYRQRFHAEKDTLAALEHPSIVPIYAAGEAGGVLYIALRLVDGPDLAAQLRDGGRMTVRDTVTTLRPIAEGVDYAHEMGIVHRDLKPSNILLDRSRRPYLTDFGLGKQIDKSLGLSAPGIALGTLAYMAPEQFTGLAEAELAGRIDVYALACVAYECVTGRPPFDGATPERLMYAHLHEPLRNRPGMSDAVETVFRKALAKNPADRYATAVDFIGALATAESISEVRTAAIVIPPTGQPQRLGAWARAHSALTGTIVAFGVLFALGLGGVVLPPAGSVGSPTPGASIGAGGTQGAVAGNGSGSLSATDPLTPGPSLPPSPPPTEPPTGSASPPPGESPSPTPTHVDPQPPQDNRPPTTGRIAINGGDKLTLKSSVTVRVTSKPSDSSGIARYIWSDSPSRPAGFGTAYRGKFSASVQGGQAGKRTIYVWFMDGANNWSTSPATDTITFDNPPVVYNKVEFNATCNETTRLLQLLTGGAPFVASDKDGRSTLRITKIWGYDPSDGDYVNFSSGITDHGRSLEAWFSPGYDWTLYFIVQDDWGVKRQGHFKVDCEPYS